MANTMEPIRDFGKIKDISDYLRVNSKIHGQRNQLMFLMGIYFGLRISRLLQLKVKEVKNKDVVYLRENKRKKERKLIINEELRGFIDEYVKDKEDYEYLFTSQKSCKAIRRETAYQILKDAGEVFGLECIGAHTLRKTYGYIIYMQTDKDPMAVKEALNVDSVQVALRYIGEIRDRSVNVMSKVRLL